MSIVSNPSTPEGFYVVGGTLRRDARSYVPRRADRELVRHLSEGALCFVLTSRQMGKSSLMVRTADELRRNGLTPAVLDLTEIGQNLTSEQWYKGLLGVLAEQIGLEEELSTFWRDRRDLGPMQRWMAALRDVALPSVAGRIVVFVDEIDAVRSLPFSTDEFFAGIRETVNGRALAPELERLTFCLLGVASPADLIRDTRTTPFNVGTRIELADFTRSEARPLEYGLSGSAVSGSDLLDRVLYWTGGHPYLTQRLCRSVADDVAAGETPDVDRSCDELFLSRRARERDDNLLFVRDRLLRSEVDVAETLDLYGRVRGGAPVPDDEANPVISVLKLSGIVSVVDGRLEVRNQIYERVFDEAWIRESMPGAEVRRQRRAFTSGLLRAAGVGIVVVVLMAGLVALAWHSRQRALLQQRIAENERATNVRLVYVAHMNLAYQAYDRGDLTRVVQILDDESSTASKGFEFYYLWRLVHAESATYAFDGPVLDVAYSVDGTRLAVATRRSVAIVDSGTGQVLVSLHNGTDGGGFALSFDDNGSRLSIASADGAVRTYDAVTGSLVHELDADRADIGAIGMTSTVATSAHLLATADARGRIRLYDLDRGVELPPIELTGAVAGGLVFSPNGRLLVAGLSDGSVRTWDLEAGRAMTRLAIDAKFVRAIAFTPDSSTIAAAANDGSIALYGASTGRRSLVLRNTGSVATVLQFSRDAKRLAVGTRGTVEVWDVASRDLMASFPGHRDQVLDLDFSPDGSSIASASVDATVRTWRIGQEARGPELIGKHDAAVYALAYSSDGSMLATASFDGTADVRDGNGRVVQTFRGHEDHVLAVAISPDGRVLGTGSADRTARLWDVRSGAELARFEGFDERIYTVAFSPDNRSFAVGSFDGTLRVFDAETHAERLRLHSEPHGSIECVAFSPDGSLIAAGGENHTVELFDASSGARMGVLTGHSDWINSLAFSPDGRLIATAGSYDDMTVAIWDVATRTRRFTLKGFSGASGFTPSSFMGPTGRANCVRFTPDGLDLVVGTTDRTVKILDVETGQELSTLLSPHESQIYSVAVAPDGLTIATASEDGTIRSWRAAPKPDVEALIQATRAACIAPDERHADERRGG